MLNIIFVAMLEILCFMIIDKGENDLILQKKKDV